MVIVVKQIMTGTIFAAIKRPFFIKMMECVAVVIPKNVVSIKWAAEYFLSFNLTAIKRPNLYPQLINKF